MNEASLLIIEPLFEEANRTRRMIAEMRRHLLKAGIASEMAELPGTGESRTEIEAVAFADWTNSLSGLPRFAAVASFRGGALLDHAVSANAYWRFSPETGQRIVRDLERARLGNADGSALFAGHKLNAAFVEALRAAVPNPLAQLRTLRLESDAGDADSKVQGAPLWRRAEPGEDAELSRQLANDLAAWMKKCAAA